MHVSPVDAVACHFYASLHLHKRERAAEKQFLHTAKCKLLVTYSMHIVQ